MPRAGGAELTVDVRRPRADASVPARPRVAVWDRRLHLKPVREMVLLLYRATEWLVSRHLLN